MDLNADVGESFGAYTLGDDQALLDVVSSASIACGFHAGDPVVMTTTVQAALEHGVVVGAHVGYRDLQGFGRREVSVPPAELTADVLYQIGALDAIARSLGGRVRFIKPHGALYNTAAVDHAVARSVIAAVRAFDPSLPVLTLPASAVVEVASECGVATIAECFADRAYTGGGALVPRSQPGAVIHDPDAVVQRAVAMATGLPIESADGSSVHVHAESMCVHGDTPGAAELARRVRAALEQAGVHVKSFV